MLFWLLNQIELQTGIVLLWPKALILCFDTLKPGLEPVLLRPGQEAAQVELQDPSWGQQERARMTLAELKAV